MKFNNRKREQSDANTIACRVYYFNTFLIYFPIKPDQWKCVEVIYFWLWLVAKGGKIYRHFRRFIHSNHVWKVQVYLWCLYVSQAAIQRCSVEKVFWKHAASLQENTHAEVRFQSNFIEIALRHGCTPVNFLHIFKALFSKNTSGWLLLKCQDSFKYRKF